MYFSIKSVKILLLVGTIAAVWISGSPAYALPIDVTVTTSGSPGDWTLDFSVTNNLSKGTAYFFGVQLPGSDITGTPAGWDSTVWPQFNTANAGGANITYNNVWIDAGGISPGFTLSGFEAMDTQEDLPASIPWFVVVENADYTGSDYFNRSTNPGFQSAIELISPTPLPATLPLFAVGLGLVGYLARRRKQSSKQALATA
jgi:hypothetical protein